MKRTGGARNVVVTGASAGVGRATAVAFARLGCNVALLARGREGLEGARRDVEAAGGRAHIIGVDMANAEAVDQAADNVAHRWGGIDIWVNNAMATVVGPADQVAAAEWKRVTEVTYLGAVYGSLAALRHMRRQDAGTIVQIGSALAYRAIPLQSAYCGAKFAVRGFTDALRTELLHEGSSVRLTMVQLPGVNTPQFDWSRTHADSRHQPVGAVYQPEAVAEAIVRAALTAPRELWVGLPAMQAIIGTMLAPGLLDRYLARTAFEEQFSSLPKKAGDPDILFSPASSDHGARGRFSAEAKEAVLAGNPALLRSGIALAAASIIAGAFLLGKRRGAAKRLR